LYTVARLRKLIRPRPVVLIVLKPERGQ
jgi:hypothetical protein